MWFQLFIEVLLRMHHKSTDRKELIDLCKEYSADNEEQLMIIEQFEREYTPDRAIWWYTRDSCFYRMMNKALRTQDFDILFSFRSFITDIAKQIERAYENFIRTNGNRNIIRVYRGQLINADELELMKNSIGQYLSMNSFLSTSRDRLTALDFTRQSQSRHNMRPILFEIKINPQLRTKAFADAQQMSYYEDENEILIMLGALFQIDQVFKDDDDQIWIARVSLASEDEFQLKEIFNHMKGKIGDDTSLDTLGKLLLRMDENEKARKCYRRMLNQTQLEVADAHLGFGWASLRCQANDEGLEHFEKSLEIRQRIHGDDHLSVAECYGFFGEAYRKKDDQETALVYLTKAMTIQENASPDGSLDLAATYDTIGNAHADIGSYDQALDFYQKTLRIREAKLPSDHPQLAAIHSHMGWSYECRNKYSKALDCYRKALDISRKTLPSTHKHIIESEKSVRRLTDKMNA